MSRSWLGRNWPFVIGAVLFALAAVLFVGALSADEDPEDVDPGIVVNERIDLDGVEVVRRCDESGFHAVLTTTGTEPVDVSVVVRFETEAGELLHQAQLARVALEPGVEIPVDLLLVERLAPEDLIDQPFVCRDRIERLAG